jgi:hypothetical protein
VCSVAERLLPLRPGAALLLPPRADGDAVRGVGERDSCCAAAPPAAAAWSVDAEEEAGRSVAAPCCAAAAAAPRTDDG